MQGGAFAAEGMVVQRPWGGLTYYFQAQQEVSMAGEETAKA